MKLENRWFTKTGKAKRVPKQFEQFKDEAKLLKPLIESREIIELVKHFRKSRNLGLYEATCVMVAFIGVYSNVVEYGHSTVNGPIFSIEKYLKGCEILGVKP